MFSAINIHLCMASVNLIVRQKLSIINVSGNLSYFAIIVCTHNEIHWYTFYQLFLLILHDFLLHTLIHVFDYYLSFCSKMRSAGRGRKNKQSRLTFIVFWQFKPTRGLHKKIHNFKTSRLNHTFMAIQKDQKK